MRGKKSQVENSSGNWWTRWSELVDSKTADGQGKNGTKENEEEGERMRE